MDFRIVRAPYNTTTTGWRGRFSLTPSKDPGLIVAVHEAGWAARLLAEHKEKVPLVLSPWYRIEGKLATIDRGPEQKAYLKAEVVTPENWPKGCIRFQLGSEADASGRVAIDYVPGMPLKIGERRGWVMSHALDLVPKLG